MILSWRGVLTLLSIWEVFGWLVQGRKSSNLFDLRKDLNGKISLLTCVLGIPIPAVEGMRGRTEKGAEECS